MAVPDLALVASTALLGVASVPHCATMCGAPCIAVTARGRGAVPVFHAARIASYAAGGALAAASVATLGDWARASRGLLGLWALLQAAMLMVGVFMLVRGRAPGVGVSTGLKRQGAALAGTPQLVHWGTLGASLAGGAWVAWPCGALQSALLVAALASTPLAGALAMAAFALCSAAGLWLAPWLWRRLAAANLDGRAVRLAGALLMLAAAWSLVRGLWNQIGALCA
ncbi:MAG: sulfite exporter TauE/SafE family protein [Paucibacter sp.]|nr:sulfite exporter TauE/SafE family protein [Roseateles sp.]